MRDGSVWLAALLAIPVTISGLTGPLRAQTGEPLLPEGPWVQVETEGFVLLGNAPEERLQSLATDAERFREAIRQVAPGIRLHTPEPARVFAFRDADTRLISCSVQRFSVPWLGEDPATKLSGRNWNGRGRRCDDRRS